MSRPSVKTEASENGKFKAEFSDVVEKYSSYVYNIALRMTNNVHDAEDIMQEVFISAYKAYPHFRGQAEVSTWLYRITVNACLMKFRKEKKSRYLVETGYEDMDIPDWAMDPVKTSLNSELRRLLEEGLARLPPDLRAAVVLRDVQGFSGQEAASILDISVSALKTRLHRGRVLIRQYLTPYVRRFAEA
ncbi:MAG: RNA polymerase sigma factor [Dehalococcoidia bacterium]